MLQPHSTVCPECGRRLRADGRRAWSRRRNDYMSHGRIVHAAMSVRERSLLADELMRREVAA